MGQSQHYALPGSANPTAEALTCGCSCQCRYLARNGLCWRCRQGKHTSESQACECPVCVCRDANRTTRVAVVGGTLTLCTSCATGHHNLLKRATHIKPMDASNTNTNTGDGRGLIARRSLGFRPGSEAGVLTSQIGRHAANILNGQVVRDEQRRFDRPRQPFHVQSDSLSPRLRALRLLRRRHYPMRLRPLRTSCLRFAHCDLP